MKTLLFAALLFAAPKTTMDLAKANPNAKVVFHPRTKIYHCESIKVPYTVKDGKPMTQAEALKEGARPQQGRYCL